MFPKSIIKTEQAYNLLHVQVYYLENLFSSSNYLVQVFRLLLYDRGCTKELEESKETNWNCTEQTTRIFL